MKQVRGLVYFIVLFFPLAQKTKVDDIGIAEGSYEKYETSAY